MSFTMDLDLYMRHHYVYAGRDLFVMARLCNHSATQDEVSDPMTEWAIEDIDCWHVQAAAGDLSRIFQICPVELQYARWVNNGRQYIVPIEMAKRLLTKRKIIGE